VDLHLVTYFVAVVDHGGITKAARSLYISQPSLSQAIRTLERRLGTTLFDRSGRRMELTEDGRRLDVAARRILADVERAKATVAAVRELESGRVDVVTYSAFSLDPLVDLISRFRLRYPGILVNVVDAEGPAAVHTALRRGAAEVGVTDLSVEYPGMVTIPLAEQELALAMHRDLAAGRPNPLPRERIRDVPLIVDLSDTASSMRVGSLVGDGAPNVVVDCAHPMAAAELMLRGTGAIFASSRIPQGRSADVALLTFEPPLCRPIGLVLRSGEPSPAAAAFVTTSTAGPLEV
jgi:DNA-binding transcriptional LysR family regulator